MCTHVCPECEHPECKHSLDVTIFCLVGKIQLMSFFFFFFSIGECKTSFQTYNFHIVKVSVQHFSFANFIYLVTVHVQADLVTYLKTAN